MEDFPGVFSTQSIVFLDVERFPGLPARSRAGAAFPRCLRSWHLERSHLGLPKYHLILHRVKQFQGEGRPQQELPMYWASVLPTPHHCAKHRSPLARCRAAGGQGWVKEERPFSLCLCPQDLTLAGSLWVLGVLHGP